jgi:hypothetical protein
VQLQSRIKGKKKTDDAKFPQLTAYIQVIANQERQQGAVTSTRSLEVTFNSTAAAKWSLDVFPSYSSFKIKNSARFM